MLQEKLEITTNAPRDLVPCVVFRSMRRGIVFSLEGSWTSSYLTELPTIPIIASQMPKLVVVHGAQITNLDAAGAYAINNLVDLYQQKEIVLAIIRLRCTHKKLLHNSRISQQKQIANNRSNVPDTYKSWSALPSGYKRSEHTASYSTEFNLALIPQKGELS